MTNDVHNFRARAQETLTGLTATNISSPYVGGVRLYYPDEFDPTILAARRGGRNLGIYNDLLREATIQAMLELRVKGQTRRPWMLSPQSAVDGTELSQDSPEMIATARIREWMEDNFKFDDFVNAVTQNALIYGIGAVDLEWVIYDDGFIAPRRWFLVDPRRVVIDDQDRARILTRDESVDGVAMPPERLFVYRHNAGEGLYPYGRGLGSTLFWLAEAKRAIALYWAAACQKNGMPTVAVETDKAMASQVINKITARLRSVEGGGVMVLPDGLKSKLLSGQVNENLFKECLQYINNEMTVLITGQRLAGAGNPQASRAASEVHNEIRLEYSEDDAKMFNKHFESNLLSHIMRINYPDEPTPVVTRDFSTRQQRALAYRDLMELVDRGLTVTDFARKVKELTGFEVSGNPQPLMQGTPKQIPADLGNAGDT